LFLSVGEKEKKVFIIFSTEIFVEQNWSKIKDFFGKKKLFQSFILARGEAVGWAPKTLKPIIKV
jgi:hypothetical protein